MSQLDHHPQAPVRLHLSRSGEASLPGGRTVSLPFRDAALLAWLALEGPTPRQRLAQLFWPQGDSESAANALRQRLFHLKKQLGDDVVSGRTTLSIGAAVTHDLDAASGVLGDAAHPFSGELAEWLERRRSQRGVIARAQLLERARAAEQTEDYAQARRAADEILAAEPLSEEAHQRLIRLHYLAGDRPLALLAFDRCEQMLRAEFGSAPSERTLALLKAIERSEPLATAAPAAPALPPTVLRPPRLVGRSLEGQAMASDWEAGHSALVIGEGGLGKTRLVHDFAAGRAGAVVVNARPGDQRVPHALLSRLLRHLLDRPGAEPPPAGVIGELARLLPELGPAAEPGAADPVRFLNAVAALVRQGEAAGLTGLVVDDLHFADEASVAALRYLVGACAELRWVVAMRPAELGSEATGLRDEMAASDTSSVYALRPLTAAEIVELVDSLGVAGLSGATLGPSLARHTGGNPLFVLETLRAMFDGGRAERGAAEKAEIAGRPAVAAGNALVLARRHDEALASLPRAGSVTRLIEQRMTRLSAQAIRLIRCAAIAGGAFSVELAAHVLAVSAIDLADPWAELAAAQIIDDGAFAHDLIAEAARQSVPAPVAIQLHAEIARFLEQRGAEPIHIAQHWLDAGDEQRALPSLLAAADRAAEAWRGVEECALLAHAARIVEAQGDAAQAFALLKRAQSAHRRNDFASAAHIAVIDEMSRLARAPHELAETSLVRSLLAADRFEPAATRAHAEAGLEAIGSDLGPIADALFVDLSYALAKSHWLADEPARAARILEAALPRLEAMDDLLRQAEFLGELGICLDNAGELTHGQRTHRKALAVIRTIGRRDYEGIVLSNLAVSLSSAGRFAEALPAVQEAWRVREQSEALNPSGNALEHAMGDALRGVGDYRGSLEWLRRYLASPFVATSPALALTGHNALALTWLHLGQYARAQQEITAALALGEEAPRAYRAKRHLLLARGALMQGRAAAARVAIEAARTLMGEVTERHALLVQLELMVAETSEPAAGHARAVAIVADVARRETHGLQMAALACASRCALAAGLPEIAVTYASSALALWPTHAPDDEYIGAVWLAAYESFAAAGDPRAGDVLQQATEWIAATARERVPDEFRESFLNRNPLNRQLLAAARAQT